MTKASTSSKNADALFYSNIQNAQMYVTLAIEEFKNTLDYKQFCEELNFITQFHPIRHLMDVEAENRSRTISSRVSATRRPTLSNKIAGKASKKTTCAVA